MSEQLLLRRTLKPLYRPFYSKIVFFLTMAILSRGMLFSISNLFGYWVDGLCQGDNCSPTPAFMESWTSLQYLQVSCGLALVSFFMTSLYRVGFARLSVDAIRKLYRDTTRVVSRRAMRFFDNSEVGRVVARFSVDFGQLFRVSGGPLVEFISLLIDLVVIVLLMGISSPFFIPLELLAITLNILAYKFHGKTLRGDRYRLSKSRGPAIGHFSETIQLNVPIKVYGRAGEFQEKFLRHVQKILFSKLKTFVSTFFFSFHLVFNTSLILFLAGPYCLYLIKHGYISLGDVGVALTFLMLLSSTLQAIFDWMAMMEDGLTGARRMNELLCASIDSNEKLPQSVSLSFGREQMGREEEELLEKGIPLHPHNAWIEAKNITLSYREDLPPALNDISLTINAKEHVGLVGRTGSGKSSFVQSLMHLYPVNSGEFLVGGYQVQGSSGEKIPVEVFRKFFGVVTQSPNLFYQSLRFNLIGDLSLSDEQVFHVLNLLDLVPWVRSLPDGLGTVIEENGKNLSSGQKQLLSLSRCLLRNAPILIMDEATSDIDPRTERKIIDVLENHFAEKTQIVVAHRPQTIERLDRLIRFQDGVLVQE